MRDEKALLTELRKMKDDSAAVRRPHEGTWYRNLAFFLGDQWVRYDGTRLVPCEVLPGQGKPVDNRLAMHTKIAVAKQTKQRPTFVATTTTIDQADMESALLREEVFESEWEERDISHLDRRARWWRYLCASGWIKVTWDRDSGEGVEVLVDGEGNPVPDPQTGAPLRPDDPKVAQMLATLQATGQPAPDLQTRKVAMGDPKLLLRSPFQMYPDPLATEEGLSSCRYVIEEAVLPPDELKQQHPDKAEKIKADTAGGLSGILPRMSGLPYAGRRRAKGEAAKVGVKTYELWELPGPTHKQGRHIIWIEGCVLLSEPMPYPWLPYMMSRGDASGEFWPKAPASDLVDPQIRLNKRIQQLDDNLDRTANPALMYPTSVSEQMQEWTGQPGEHIQIPDEFVNVEPKYLQPPNTPSSVDNEIERAIQSMREISGQNEASTGLVPAGVTAASAINLIQEANDTQLGPDIAEAETALQDLGNKLMWLLAKYASDERIARIAGEDGDWDVRKWRGDQLAGADGKSTLKVQVGSSLPRSIAAKQAAMSQLMDLLLKYSGGVQALDPRNLRRFLSEYEVGALEKMFSDIAVDEQKVNREHRRMGLSQPVGVHPRDNHAFEIDAHNEFRKTPRYERLAAAIPGFVERFEAHIAEHEQAMVGEARRQQDLAIVMAGPPSQQPQLGMGEVNGNAPPGVNGNSQSQVTPGGGVPSPSQSA